MTALRTTLNANTANEIPFLPQAFGKFRTVEDAIAYLLGAVTLGITRAQIASSVNLPPRFFTKDGAPWIPGTSDGPMAIQDGNSNWRQIDLSNGTNLAWFGGVGDYSLLTQTGTDNATAISAALNASSNLYVPPGNYLFSNIADENLVYSANITGPGDLYYNTGSGIYQVGGTIRCGVSDTSGVVGVPNQQSQGGLIIGGEGPGPNGMLLCNQQNSWMQIQPTRTGSSSEFQIYTNAHVGVGSVTIGGNTITATYNDFSSADIAVGDVVAFNKTLYLVASKPDSTHITVTDTGGGAVSFAASTTGTWRHAYWYCDGHCSTSGTTVNWVSGDYFVGFSAAWAATQANITINGVSYQCATKPSKTQITVTSSAGTQTNVPFTQKVLPNSLEITTLRLQSIYGGSEEEFAIYHTLQGAVNIESSCAGSGGFLPLVFRTGHNYDNTSTGSRVHFEISEDGRVGIGADYNAIGWPSANSKINVFRDPLVAASSNGSTVVSMLAINNTYSGNDARTLELGTYNNFNAGFIQGWSSYGVTPSTIALQPRGGAVAIGLGSQTAGLATVFATTPKMSVASANAPVVLGNYTADQFGHRLDFVKSRSATVNGQTIVQSADSCGDVNFCGSDGTNVYGIARISGLVDGAPAAGTSMPGSIVFSTTASGATTVTQRIKIDNAGNIAPIANNAYTNGSASLKWSAVYSVDLYSSNASFLVRTKTTLNTGAAAATGTLTNAPASGNPTKWIPIDDNGTTRYIPAW